MLVSNTSWSFVKFRISLIKVLVQKGYEVFILAPEDEESHVFGTIGAVHIPIRCLEAKGLNPISDIAFFRELTSIINVERPHLIIQYTIKPNIYGSFAARRMKIPHIAVVTGLGFTFIKGGWMAKLTSWIYRLAFKSPDSVWFLNNTDRELFVSKGLVDKKKTLVLPGEGIDAEFAFNPDLLNVEGADRSRDERIRFIFVGRLLFDKGIKEFVEASRILKKKYANLDFNVLGYTNVNNPSAISEEVLAQWVDSKDVYYLGSAKDVRPILLGQDCVVLPSYREGMSTTLMEAAALALPVIASDVPGCRELIDDGVNGFLCQVKNALDLANQMERFILLEKEERYKMGRASREKMLSEFLDSYVHRVYLEWIGKIEKA